jgi:hypothetical protein
MVLLGNHSRRIVLSKYDPCNTRPHANRGPTATTALLFYVDGVPGLDGDPFAACAALHSLCCLFFWLFCLAPPMLTILRCLCCLRACPLFEWRISRPCTYK